jgi:hypothetical protein
MYVYTKRENDAGKNLGTQMLMHSVTLDVSRRIQGVSEAAIQVD